MIVTLYWGFRFYIQRTSLLLAIRLALANADEPGIGDWFAVALLFTMLLGLVEASRG